jgi:thiazolinyl imide reductase
VTGSQPLRVLVCGTNFGRLYAETVRDREGYVLAGILARGSAASRAYAERLGVPLHTSVDAVAPGSVDTACVVVGSAVSGGQGTELARALMARGIHVLQEHPLHPDELAQCAREARRHGVQYRLTTHYPNTDPVRRFTDAARRLTARQEPLFVDAATPVHLMQPLVDILGRALGGLRPWSFAPPAALPEGFGPQPFRTLQGVVAGVPLTLRVHHQMDPADRDNHALHWHRIAIGTEGGVLTLADTHGPLLWSPRLHAGRDADHRLVLDGPGTGRLDLTTTTVIGSTGTFREVFAEGWRAAIGRSLDDLAAAMAEGADPLAGVRYDLAVGRAWADLAAVLGPPEVVRPPVPRPLAVHEVFPDASPEPAPEPAPGPATGEEPAAEERAAGDEPPYSPSAEFFDLVAAEHTATASAPAVAAALTGIDTGAGPVVDIGAGTGLVTEAIARALPRAEVIAAEPATAMRAVLTSRVFGDPVLRERVTVTDGAAPGLDLPDRISAAVLCGVLGHLDPVQRGRLWERVLSRLAPGGRVVVELMQLTRPQTLPETRLATATAGRHHYTWHLSGEPDTDGAMELRSIWRVRDGAAAGSGAVLREVHDAYRWFPLDLAAVAEESGLHPRPLPTRPGAPPLAVLTREPHPRPTTAEEPSP